MVMEVGQLLSSKAFPRLWVTGGPWRTTDWWLVMVRPMQTVKAYGVQDRRSTTQAKLPWVVRYTIDGRHRSKSFRTRIEAERYRGLLLQAVQVGGRFDETTGEPESW